MAHEHDDYPMGDERSFQRGKKPNLMGPMEKRRRHLERKSNKQAMTEAIKNKKK